MNVGILLCILFDLLSRQKVTARYLADKHGISERTVYRYIERLSCHIPLHIQRGRGGGVCIADNYKLPVGFLTVEEYEATMDSLALAYARTPEERFLNAKRKLSAQIKTERKERRLCGESGSLFIDVTPYLEEENMQTLRLMEESVKDKILLDIAYHNGNGEKKQQRIEPHALVLQRGIWHTYAFARTERAFRLFCLKDIFSVRKTEDTFSRRSFAQEDIPFFFRQAN